MTQALQDAFDRKGPIRAIGVVGMGYVGIPAAVLFSHVPEISQVLGFQRRSSTSGYKIDMLNGGECPLKGKEPDLEELLKQAVLSGRFECSSDFSRITELDAITIAIQTPFLRPEDLEPDLSALLEGIRQVGRHMAEGTLVVLESTITPGTTTGIARQILEEESGLCAGADFGLAHAPERVMVGRLVRNIRDHDRIVGGIDDASTRRAVGLYTPVLRTGRIIPMTATAAEVTKTAENTFRDLQIAAVNQLALYCEAMGVNILDVREGIASLRGEGISRGILFPGAGVGGHCLTKDTYHLERGIEVLGDALDFPAGSESLYVLARRINDFMPEHMFRLTVAGLSRCGKCPEDSKIAILGWAFLANTDDARNTPAAPFRALMLEAGADVAVHDPYVADAGIEHDMNTVLHNADAVVIFTGHDAYRSLEPVPIKGLCKTDHPVIVDGRNLVDADAYISCGFIYKGIGRGDANSHEIETG